MTRMGKANEKGLEEVSKVVLAPGFHADDVTAKKVCTHSHPVHRFACLAMVLVILRTQKSNWVGL